MPPELNASPEDRGDGRWIEDPALGQTIVTLCCDKRSERP